MKERQDERRKMNTGVNEQGDDVKTAKDSKESTEIIPSQCSLCQKSK